MASVKFCTTETRSGDVVARVFAGPDDDSRKYAGTIVLPEDVWEKFLDITIYGASQMRGNDNALRVFFGPDDEDET